MLKGQLRDGAGKAIAGAQVILGGLGDGGGETAVVSRETTSDGAGRFVFTRLPAGTYTLTAGAMGMRSVPVRVMVDPSGPDGQPPVSLELAGSGGHDTASSPAMQLADEPDFAIASVTDWTAAGGHGSDASLRTSEALTRDALGLPSGISPAGAAGGRTPENHGDASPKPAPPSASPCPAGAGGDDCGLEEAGALEKAGDLRATREELRRLEGRRPDARLYRREGELDERLGDPLSAVHAFQEAAREEPSEDNYHRWGSELLVHRAIWQAREVFDQGVRLYPRSVPMLTARGAALFAADLYEQAALDLCRASDLNPQAREPYLFMGKIAAAAPDPLSCVAERLDRFERLRPGDPLAAYYLAMALERQRGTGPATGAGGQDSAEAQLKTRDGAHVGADVGAQVTALLTRAVSLDPGLADGYLQLGILSARDERWKQAAELYTRAVQANPELAEAHYRLGVACRHLGQEASAREQFALHDELARRQAAEVDRERQAVKQFVVVLPESGEAPGPGAR